MDCPSCGTESPPGQRFCGSCGSSLALICAACGAENSPGNRFCGSCGTALVAAVGETSPSSPTSPDSERRVVSVLFVDLVGFTSYSEHRDPEDVRAMITRYFDLAKQVIGRFGGTVDKFIGDAVMAWWGATESNEDDAERAVRAALDLVDRVAALGDELGIDGLSARAGVMTGETSVGPGGNEQGLLLGDLVNSASRLQSLAQPGSVYLGRTTGDLVGDAVELSAFESHVVKGKSEPVEAARVIQVLSERGGRGKAGSLTPPFTGRAAELRLLKDMLDSCGRDGRARMVSLIGQAGIGKSRLVWEFLKYVDGLADTIYWHEGRSPSYGEGMSLWALGEMVRSRAGIGETDPDSTGMERLRSAVEEFITDPSERQWIESRLAVLLGFGENSGSDRTELFAAARAFFEAIAARGTTVLVFEDLHWADQGLLEFVEELTDWSQNHPILVVAMTRPDLLERRPGWGSGRRGSASIHLSPLSDNEMQEMVEGAVPGIPIQAKTRIADASGGVPLFAVETLRMLIGAGRLTVQDGVVTVADDLEGLEVPQSVHAVVAARIDRLSTDEKEVVRNAAVLGHSFTLDAIASMQEEELDKVERRLADLVRHDIFELIRDPRSPERGQYQWVQSVLREVAYGRVAKSDRHDLHLHAARYFRDLDDVELAPVAASHYLSAAAAISVRDEALDLETSEALRSALARAESLHAHEQILGLVKVAVDLVTGDLSADMREAGALAASAAGDITQADAHVSAMLVEAGDDESAKRRAIWLTGKIANESRRPERGVELLRPHLDPRPDLSTDPYLARAAVELARSELLIGNDAAAAQLADDALGAVERLGLVDSIADALITRGTALAFSRNTQALALLHGALQLCRDNDLSATGLRCLINIGYASSTLSESYQATVEAFAEAKRVGDRSHASFIACNLAGYQLEAFEFDEAESLLAEPIYLDAPFDQSSRFGMLGWAAGCRGDLDSAKELYDRAVEIADSVRDPQALMNAKRVASVISLLNGDVASGFAIHEQRFAEHQIGQGFAVASAFDVAALAGDAEMLQRVLVMAGELSSVYALPIQAIHDFLALYTGSNGVTTQVEQWVDQFESDGARWSSFQACLGVAGNADLPDSDRTRFRERALGLAERAGASGLIDMVSVYAPIG